MDPLHDLPADLQPEWARSMPWEVFAEIVVGLRGALPPPLVDDPECWARRDQAALDAIAALRPGNAVEARLAAEFVTTDSVAMDCLRLAGACREDRKAALRHTAQGMAMMRASKGALRMLLGMQAARRKAVRAAPARKALSAEAREVWAPAPAVGDRRIH